MRHLFFFSSLLFSFSLFGQGGSGVPGTLNQIDKDPAVEGFQNSYDDLQQEMRDLINPQRQEQDLPTDAMEKTESSLPDSPESDNYVEEKTNLIED